MRLEFAAFIALLISAPLYANEFPQQFKFSNNEKLQLTLSSSAYNKIFIPNEKITDFYFVPGDFIIADTNDLDEFVPKEDGAIYLVPQTDKNAVIYLTTNKGHHVALEVRIAEKSGQIISLVFNGYSKKPATTLSLAQKMTPAEQLIKAIAEGRMPVGFKGGEVAKAKIEQWDNGVNLKMIRAYQNQNTSALVYLATNASNKPIEVTPKEFSRLKAKAISLSEERLNPGQSMYVYAIKEESHHA